MPTSDRLPPQRARRLLRAKAAALENRARMLLDEEADDPYVELGHLTADLALVAGLLLDLLDRLDEPDAP